MTIKLRIVGYQVQPVLFADDGENLEPVPVQPITVKAADMDGFNWEEALEPVRAQVENETLTTP